MNDPERERAASELYQRYVEGDISADDYQRRYELIQRAGNSFEIQSALQGIGGQPLTGSPAPPGWAPPPGAHPAAAPQEPGYTPPPPPPPQPTYATPPPQPQQPAYNPPPPPPSYGPTVPATYPPSQSQLAASPRAVPIWVAVLLIIAAVIAVLDVLVWVLVFILAPGSDDPAAQRLGSMILALPALLVLAATVPATIGVMRRHSWGKVMAIVAGVVLCLTVVGLPLGIPVLIGAVRA